MKEEERTLAFEYDLHSSVSMFEHPTQHEAATTVTVSQASELARMEVIDDSLKVNQMNFARCWIS